MRSTPTNMRMLPAGELLLEVGRPEDLQIEVEVLSQEAVDITPGDPVAIIVPTVRHEPLRGMVSRVEPRGFTKVSSLGVSSSAYWPSWPSTPRRWPDSGPRATRWGSATGCASASIRMPTRTRWPFRARRSSAARRIDGRCSRSGKRGTVTGFQYVTRVPSSRRVPCFGPGRRRRPGKACDRQCASGMLCRPASGGTDQSMARRFRSGKPGAECSSFGGCR